MDLPKLTVPSNQATEEIEGRIQAGESIISRKVQDSAEGKALKRDFQSWDSYNEELLKLLFTDNSISEEYASVYPLPPDVPVSEAPSEDADESPDPPPARSRDNVTLEEVGWIQDTTFLKVDKLRGILLRVKFMGIERPSQSSETPEDSSVQLDREGNSHTADSSATASESLPRQKRIGQGKVRHAGRARLTTAQRQLLLAQYASDVSGNVDHVGIESDVTSFAYLLSARNLEPPLAIGLFGDWGSGKTFFMRFLQRRIDSITEAARESKHAQRDIAIYRSVIQIEFNAWHYVEGNLWASLVDHIFRNLRTSSKEGESTIAQRRQVLTSTLESTRREQEAAESLIDELSHEINERNQEIQQLEREQEQRLAAIQEARLWDLIRRISFSDLDANDQRMVKDSLDRVGFTEAGQAADDLLKAVQDAREVLNRGNALTTPMREKGWKWAAALISVVLVAPLVSWILGQLDFSAVTNAAASIAAFLAGLTAILKSGTTWLTTAMDKVEKADQRLRTKVEEANRANAQRVAALRVELARLSEQQRAATQVARDAQKRITDIQSRISRLTPAQLLADFIAERAASGDYQKLLGLTSVIRRDFDELSQLIEGYNSALLSLGQGEAPHLGADFSRIILYIDDLDRCPPGRVVEVLQAVHLLLSFRLFVVVVAVDARWLAQSLESEYKDLLSAGSTVRQGEYLTPGATPDDYLEKIFQIPFWIRPLDTRARDRLVRGLLDSRGLANKNAVAVHEATMSIKDADNNAPESSRPEPDQYETAESELYNRLSIIELNPSSLELGSDERDFILALTPLLGKSPRSVKRFLNIYRLMKSVAMAGGEEFVTPDEHARYKIAMLLLAVVTGLPAASPALFRALWSAEEELGDVMEGSENRDTDPTPGTLEWLMARPELRTLKSSVGEEDLNRLRDWLEEHEEWKYADAHLFVEMASTVARYSFRSEASQDSA
jgi:KAP family P-loop domain